MSSPEPDALPRSATESQRFAAAVLTARTQRRMSRLALAEQVGISLQEIQDLERGYPVPREVAAALCRNLDLPEPALESSPLTRFALRLRQQRGLARLSRAQLAGQVSVTSQVIRALEMASLRPSPHLCLGLLAVQALQLHESDVAAFLRPATAGADGGSLGDASTPHSSTSGPQGRAEAGEPPRRSPGRPAGSGAHSRPRSHSSAGNHLVATFLIRFYANGRVALEMRPLRPRLRRETPARARQPKPG